MLLKQLRIKFRKECSKFLIAPFGRFINSLKYKHLANLDKTIYIDIDSIDYWYRGSFYGEMTYLGQIKGGDWDNNLTSFSEMIRNSDKYKGLVEHFCDGLPWSKTELFQKRYQKELKKYGKVHVKSIDSINKLEEYYIRIYDELYNNIKKHVIISENKYKNIDPIYIHIYKNGEILYTVDGNHRLFIAMIQGISRLPVKVWKRHSNWQNIREHILSNNGIDVEEKFKKYLDHPDIKSELHTIK